MAEHVFESAQVEEFYNSCHTKADGRFCGVGAKGKGVRRIPMSDNARKSNQILRGLAAARRSPEYKAQKRANKAIDKKYDTANAARRAKDAAKKKIEHKDTKHGSGKTDPKALSLTEKYGSRNRPGGIGGGSTGKGKASAPAAKAPTKAAPKKDYKNDKYGSGKTDPKALSLTQKYGSRRG